MTKKQITNTITEAQLYWDSQDPNNCGWYLRYCLDGAEEGCAIEADADESTEELASLLAPKLSHHGRIEIAIYRGDERRGRIVVDGGSVENWEPCR